MKLLSVPLRSLKEQQATSTKLDDLREETQRLARLYERKHAALEALQNSLLPSLAHCEMKSPAPVTTFRTPFQGFSKWPSIIPGRCPGLWLNRPFGAAAESPFWGCG